VRWAFKNSSQLEVAMTKQNSWRDILFKSVTKTKRTKRAKKDTGRKRWNPFGRESEIIFFLILPG